MAQNDTADDQSTDEKTTSLDDCTSSESDASGGEDIRAPKESFVTRKSARLRNSVNSRSVAAIHMEQCSDCLPQNYLKI